ncbi:MAG: DNA-processing protein DprA [Kofleriaceae bacterium]
MDLIRHPRAPGAVAPDAIVSGLATGIDTEAHPTAIEADGQTIRFVRAGTTADPRRFAPDIHFERASADRPVIEREPTEGRREQA